MLHTLFKKSLILSASLALKTCQIAPGLDPFSFARFLIIESQPLSSRTLSMEDKIKKCDSFANFNKFRPKFN